MPSRSGAVHFSASEWLQPNHSPGEWESGHSRQALVERNANIEAFAVSFADAGGIPLWPFRL